MEPPVNTSNTSEHVAELRQRVHGLERGFEDFKVGITTELRALGEKFDSRSKPQYGLQISLAGLMFTALAFVGTAWKAPIETSINQVQTDVHRMQSDYVPKWVHDKTWEADRRETEAIQSQIRELQREIWKRSPAPGRNNQN